MTGATERQPLTARQVEILRWVAGYIETSGFSPTLRELCLAFGFKSPNGAACHLEPLRKKGWLTWQAGHSRTIRVSEGVDLGL